MANNSDEDDEMASEEQKWKFAEAWHKKRQEKSEKEQKRDVALSDNHYQILGLEDY